MSTEIEKRGRGRPPMTVLARETFLTMLATTHQVRRACEAAGIDRSTAYLLRKRDPDFSAQWELAMSALPDAVMDAVVRMAKLDSETPEQAPTFKLFDRFHGKPNVAINNVNAVQVNEPDPAKDYADLRAKWLRGYEARKARERGEVIEAESAPVSDDECDLI